MRQLLPWGIPPSLRTSCLGTVALALLLAFGFTGCSESPLEISKSEISSGTPQPLTDLTFDPADVIEVDPYGDAATGIGEGDGTYHWLESMKIEPDESQTMEIGPHMTLRVSEGAVTSEVRITADVWVRKVNSVVEWVVFDFDPSMTFAQPISLVVDQGWAPPPGPDGVYRLWYFDETLGTWVVAAEGDPDDNKVTYTLDHFSMWALSR